MRRLTPWFGSLARICPTCPNAVLPDESADHRPAVIVGNDANSTAARGFSDEEP